MLSCQESNWCLLILEGCRYLYDFNDIIMSLCNDITVSSCHTVFSAILQIWQEKHRHNITLLHIYIEITQSCFFPNGFFQIDE